MGSVRRLSSITQERLLIVGDVIRVARGEALTEHRPDKWETNWSLGVRQFERTNGSITWATQEYPWLTVVAGIGGGPVEYVFTIAGHPIRVCRGGPEEVPVRFQDPCFPELVQQQLMLTLDSVIPQGRCLRIVVENDLTGAPADIYLVEIDESTGTPIRSYLIPSLAYTTTVTDFAPPVEAVDIPPVSAEPIESVEQEQQDPQENKKTGSDDQ